MIGVRRTKTLREIRQFKARTVLVVLAIAVGVGAFGLMSAGRTILERDMQLGFATARTAHAVLSLAAFDHALVERVAQEDDVAEVEARRSIPARIAVPGGRWVTLDLQAADNWDRVAISRIVPEADGPAHPPAGAMLLERATASQFKLEVGGSVRVRLADGGERDLRVAGLVSDQTIMPSNINTNTAYGYIGLETLELLDQPRDYNQLYLRLTGDRAAWSDVEPAATRIAEAIAAAGHPVLEIRIPRPGKPPLWDTMNGVLFILGTMGVLTLALSGFLIVNVMWAVVARQIPQIGVIKSLGGRSGQIARLYLEMVLIFGGLALLVALPLAFGGAYGLAVGVAQSLNVSITRVELPLTTVATLALTALVVPSLAALIPIITGARITIREAISGRADGTTREPRVGSAAPGPLRRLAAGVPTLLLLATRNTFRRMGRVGLTLVALSLAGAMFVAVLGVRQSLQGTALAMQAEASYDVEVTFARPYPAGDILAAARRTPGVGYAEVWGMASARRVFGSDRVGGSMLLIGLPPDTRMALPSVTKGRRLQGGDRAKLFVNSDAFDLLQNAAVGQPVELRVNDSDQTWELIGTSARGFVPIAYVPYADFEQAVGMPGYAGRLVVEGSGKSAAEQTAVQRALLAELEQAGFEINRSSTTAESQRTIAANLDIIAIMLLSMVALVAVVGGLGLASTMSINVLERTREIGVLRSLGAKTPVVRRVVLLEGLVIGLLSALIGTLGSVPLGMWLGGELGPRVLYHTLDFAFSWPGAALWLLIVAVIAVVASLAPAQSAARLTIRETLVYDG